MGKAGGKKMWNKSIASFATETPIVIYHMHNQAHQKTIIKEMEGILTDARDLEASNDCFYKDTTCPIPQMSL